MKISVKCGPIKYYSLLMWSMIVMKYFDKSWWNVRLQQIFGNFYTHFQTSFSFS